MPAPVVDAHLDLAYNVLAGRDLTRSVAEIRAREQRTDHQCTVTLPELRRGSVAVVFGTLFVGPSSWDGDGAPVYDYAPWDRAREQLAIYLGWRDAGLVRLITSASELDAHLSLWEGDGVPGLVLLMESADPIERPADLPQWWDAGVRVIGPAWSRTRYAGGTHRPFGLTADGRELVARMAESRVALDMSHMAEEAFWQSLEIGAHAVLASHSNARAIVDTDRQLGDGMIQAVGARGGVVGLNLYNHFLHPGWSADGDKPPVTLADARRHLEHAAGLIGWGAVGIGSDLDGGLGREEIPAELDSIADLALVADLAPAEHRDGVLGGNWLRWLRATLP